MRLNEDTHEVVAQIDAKTLVLACDNIEIVRDAPCLKFMFRGVISISFATETLPWSMGSMEGDGWHLNRGSGFLACSGAARCGGVATCN